MMLNPISVKTLKEIGKTLTTKPGEVKLNTNNYDWIVAKA
jgi:acetyl-CoA decarbonylase/synthase complex subunit delta